MTPRATVVVVTWNGAHLLPDCLDALAKQDLPEGSWRTVVVDNASTDGTLELLRRDFPDVEVVANPRNDGFAGGNNVALRAVTTPYAVLLNNDARPEPDWLRHLLEPLDDDPRLGAVTSKVLFLPRFLQVHLEAPVFRAPGDGRELGLQLGSVLVDGQDVTDDVLWESFTYPAEGQGAGRFRWTRPAGSFLVPLPAEATAPVVELVGWAQGPTTARLRTTATDQRWELGTSPGRVALALDPARACDVVNNAGGLVLPEGHGADRGFQEVDTGQYDEPCEVFTACGAAVALRTTAARAAGFFDEDFFLYYEDCDLSWRLRAAGWAVRYEPRAVVRHMHSASTGEWSPLFTFHVERNRLLMLTKDATAALALREVLRFPLTTVSLAVQELRRALPQRRRPAVRPTLLRARVMASYLRLLPRMLRRRWSVQRGPVKAADLQRRWLAPR